LKALDLRNQTLSHIQQELNALQGQSLNRAQFLLHGEAHALMQAHAQLGELPKQVTIYVDRYTCNMCASEDKGLGLLRQLYGIDTLTVISSESRVFKSP
jgi:tRNA(Arg) A34 adenosine deaminase TadA